MLTERQKRIIFLRSAIQRGQMHHDRTVLYASYWTAQATTGVCKKRNMSKPVDRDSDGTTWRQLTGEEKTEEALRTAMNHIHNLEENTEDLIKFREELDSLEFEENND